MCIRDRSYIEEGRLGEGQALKIFPTAKSTEIFMLNKTDWDKFADATGASLDSLANMESLVAVSYTHLKGVTLKHRHNPLIAEYLLKPVALTLQFLLNQVTAALHVFFPAFFFKPLVDVYKRQSLSMEGRSACTRE